MSQTNPSADFAGLEVYDQTALPAGFPVGEALDAEMQDAVFGAVTSGADSKQAGSVIVLDEGLSVAPSEADLDYAWRGDEYGLSASAGPQDLYTIGQVSNEGPGVLAENQASMNDYWLSAQDNAVAQGNPIKYFGAGLMRSFGNIGYGIAEMGVGLWVNPGSGGAGAAKAVVNFGPEAFNFGVNTLKTVLDGYTLLAETAGLQEGSLQSFRDSDPFNITPLFSYDSPAESGGALFSGLVSGAAYTKLSRLRPYTSTLSKTDDGVPLTGISSLDSTAIGSSSFTQKLDAMVRSGFEVIEDSKFISARGQFDGMKFIYNPETMTRLDFAHEWRHFGQLKQMIDRGITPLKSNNMRMANSPAEFGAYSYEQKLWERINVKPTDNYMNFHTEQLEYFEQGLGSYRAQLSKPYNAKWRGINW